MTSRTLVVAVLVLLPAAVLAVDRTTPVGRYIRTSWTEHDGLPSNIVWAIAQDRDGYLWLGTSIGLVRFDGVRFVRWDARQSPDLFQGDIRALCAARDGSLWMGFLSGGVSRMHDARVMNYGPDDGVPEDAVVALFEDRDGTVWAGGRGISRYRGGTWERVQTPEGFSGDLAVHSFYEDRAGTLWVATSEGVLRRKPGSDRLDPFASVPPGRAITEDDRGHFWIAGLEEVVEMVLPEDRPNARALRRIRVRARGIVHNGDGTMWVTTSGEGVLRIVPDADGRGLNTERYSVDPGLVTALLRDREGNIWTGEQDTFNRLTENRLLKAAPEYQKLLALPVDKVTGAKDGAVWLGTTNGLYKFTAGKLRRFDRADGLPSAFVRSLYTDASGGVWVATTQGVARFENGQFRPWSVAAGKELKAVLTFTIDGEGSMWLSDLNRGVFRWKDNRLESLEAIREIGRKAARILYTDRAGRVWLSLRDGSLLMYERDRFRVFSSRDGLRQGSVRAFYEDRDGMLWIGGSAGLARFQDGHFRTTTALPIADVTAITGDTHGNLWLGGSSGIVRLDAGEFDRAAANPSYVPHYMFFDMSDGLPGSPTFLGSESAARSADGALWFVTTAGVAVIDPEAVAVDPRAVPVKLEEIVIDGERLGNPLPPRTVHARPATIEISYTALTLTASDKVRFRYRLDGFDSEWVNAGRRRQAFYTNLPPGDYRFQVTADSAASGNESSAAWEFSIPPAFHQTATFYALCLTAAGVGVWTVWRWRLSHLRREFSLVLAERTRVAREIHDTLLQSLVGVALQCDELASEVDRSPHVAKEHIGRIRKQVERYVRETRQSIWRLRSPALEQMDMATALRDAAENLIGSRSIRLDFSVHGTPRRCSPTIEEQLLRIGQEAVSNAIQHAGATRVQLELRYEHHAVGLRVSDDGHGFDVSDPTYRNEPHFGLTTMRERADHIGGTFRITSSAGAGTQVEVVTPLRLRQRTNGPFQPRHHAPR